MLDIVCTPTPFIVGLLSSSLPQLTELPLEEVRGAAMEEKLVSFKHLLILSCEQNYDKTQHHYYKK